MKAEVSGRVVRQRLQVKGDGVRLGLAHHDADAAGAATFLQDGCEQRIAPMAGCRLDLNNPQLDWLWARGNDHMVDTSRVRCIGIVTG